MIELLSPVGDFECLKAAVQNGADAVYFGANMFSARAFASNFDDDSLEQAINYAKIRGVKTNLTLNTLIKNDEFSSAVSLAERAYNAGIDAILVQDLGLASYLIKNFPDLAIHASTQMSVHNLEGVLKLQEMGFSRVVLSRELSLEEIKYICENSNVEIEAFVHGAICISYSGQCLFSSMIGGRSGNRGKCAQPCRLPYELLENNNVVDKGYLLSPRDLCGIDFLPYLVNSGVSCIKIEGRMKTPEYVATVTRIYRKYLDLAISGQKYTIDENNKKDLLQVFNRGGFSHGHLESSPNTNLIEPRKSNNMGIYLGKITNFNSNKGHISFSTSSEINVGDKINIENKKHENNTYTISELMINNKNISQAHIGDFVKIGRMKGNINVGDRIYKITDKKLSDQALETLEQENKKKELICNLIVKKDQPITITISSSDKISIQIVSDIIPEKAINTPITKERLYSQINKITNTPFRFKEINIELDNGLYIPSISKLNELRRNAISEYETKLISSFKRNHNLENTLNTNPKAEISPVSNDKKISLLLTILKTEYDYSTLNNVDNVYIPLKYFTMPTYFEILSKITSKFDVFIYLPTIMRSNYTNLLKKNISKILATYKIRGFVISNIGNLKLLEDYKNYDLICNYTFNVYNNNTINELNFAKTVTLSPELSKLDIQKICKNYNNTSLELIVYGRTPLMNTNYCLLGKSNKCYKNCEHKCNSKNDYYLKDRLGFKFKIIPDNIETVTTIYNSKITSIEHDDLYVNSVRIDILDEDLSQIQNIVNTVKSGNKFEGKDFTNGNLYKNVDF